MMPADITADFREHVSSYRAERQREYAFTIVGRRAQTALVAPAHDLQLASSSTDNPQTQFFESVDCDSHASLADMFQILAQRRGASETARQRHQRTEIIMRYQRLGLTAIAMTIATTMSIGCVGDPAESTGSIGMELQIAPGVTINTVSWAINNSTS